MPVSEVRERLAEVIEGSGRSGEPVCLTRRGRAVAVLTAPDIYQRLTQDAEDAIDRAAVELSAEDDDFIPWDEVKAELGLT